MNKIKIEVIGERVKVSFDFENIQVARQSFEDEDFIEDVIGALDYEIEKEPEESDETKRIKEGLRENLCKGSVKQLSEIKGWIQEELNKRK
jgi:hypothetical protein